jgi:acid phosphatase family membrane protein YuiD
MIIWLLFPVALWLLCQSLKLLLRRGGRLTDYGGFPSSHAAVAAGVATVAVVRGGLDNPLAVLAVGFAWITVTDAVGFRRQVAAQAAALNRLLRERGEPPLSERLGHTPFEVHGGAALGIALGWVAARVLP